MNRTFHHGYIAAAIPITVMLVATILIAIILLLASCGGSSGGSSGGGSSTGGPDPDPTPPDTHYLDPPGETRTWLTADQLDADEFPEQSPFHNAYFMPVGDAGPPLHDFSGTLRFDFHDLETNGDRMFFDQRMDLFPDIALRFVRVDDYLVPLDRGRQFKFEDESSWGLILSPGRVWSEPGDGNRSRASFPFLLINSNLTQGHNGIATFLYDDATVSRVRLQVIQETASWEMYDYWGHLPATYTAEVFPDAQETVDAFDAELANAIPHEPWELLEALDIASPAEFYAPISSGMISIGAVLWEGKLYIAGCHTRYGDFPYCRYMRNAVFSVTKSAVAAVALLRLAQKFGPGVLDERIEDHVDVTADHGGWANVTFRNALDMATGIGDYDPDPDSNVTFGDEDQPKFNDFQFADSAMDKLDVVFSYADYPWGPDEKVRYNSINTFALAAAMDAYLKKTPEGPDANLHDMVVEEVFEPIGIHHAPMLRTIEADDAPGLPVLYSGYYPTLDEIARIAQLFQDGGVHEGDELLHPQLTASALYRDTETGLQAIYWANDIEHTRYQQSFWSWASEEESGCIAHTAVMVGFGGNLVALLPNGATAFRFTDAHFYNPRSVVETARVFGPLCN